MCRSGCQSHRTAPRANIGVLPPSKNKQFDVTAAPFGDQFLQFAGCAVPLHPGQCNDGSVTAQLGAPVSAAHPGIGDGGVPGPAARYFDSRGWRGEAATEHRSRPAARRARPDGGSGGTYVTPAEPLHKGCRGVRADLQPLRCNEMILSPSTRDGLL